MDDTPHHLAGGNAKPTPRLASADGIDWSQYYVVHMREYYAMCAEIERLRALCNDLHHDATCSESFCRLCGEGIREWEARRG